MAGSYDINLKVKFEQLEHIDVGAEAAAVEPWFNQTLTAVNDSVVRLGVHQGVTIPRGVVHRPRAPQRTVIVMVEPATVVPTGDS